MSITDKILNFVKLNDDDDYEDDYDEEEEDYAKIEKAERRRFAKKGYDEEDDEYSIQKPVQKQRSVKTKVVPVRKGGMNMEVCVIKPATIEDGREITNTLVSGRAVVLNLEGIHVELAQRIIDFTSGSCFAIDGNLQKVSNYIFIATPPSVDISGDFQEIINNNANISDV